MKEVKKDKILNIEFTDKFDNKFLFKILDISFRDVINHISTELSYQKKEINNLGTRQCLVPTKIPPAPFIKREQLEIVFMEELLREKENKDLLSKVKEKPGIYSNVYSPEDELEIFKELFDNALKNNKRIHIIGVTLTEEIEILEKYYEELGFMREDINCFRVDFSIPLVTVSVKIENIMWRGSDYKRLRDKIFFIPPVRESGQVKAMYKGINRGVIAGIYTSPFERPVSSDIEGINETGLKSHNSIETFLGEAIKQEHILPITLSKVLRYNYEEIGFFGDYRDLIVEY